MLGSVRGELSSRRPYRYPRTFGPGIFAQLDVMTVADYTTRDLGLVNGPLRFVSSSALFPMSICVREALRL